MKCRHCGKRYSAAVAQSAPGGSSPPGCILLFALSLAGLTLYLFRRGSGWPKWVCLALTLLIALNVWDAWLACESGKTCPRCGGENRVYPWSF